MTVELASILISDLVGSTGLEARLGPVVADDLRREHFALLREAIEGSDGREVKNTGDGIMVAFASPSKAAECAQAMQSLIERRNRASDEHLHIRIGIGSGEATLEDGDYFGMPSIEAARLCDKAPSDGILVSATTQMLTGRREGLVFESVGALELKGIPEPVEAFSLAWAPLGAEAAKVPLPAALRSVPAVAYVGRRDEREQLAAWSHEARAGTRRVVFLSGEPGIGKTRLAAHTALDAGTQGATVLWGAAAEDLGTPYGVWIETLTQLVEHAPPELLADHIERHGGELSRLVRGLGQRVPDHPAPRQTDPETERYLLMNAVADLLEAACAEGPVVLALDDLQWADKQTLSLLKHVSTSLEGAALLVLVTYRDSELKHGHPLSEVLADLHGVPGVSRLALGGLGVDDVTAIMSASAGHEMDERGLALAGEIAQETDGNPFFVAEILRHLIESGGLSQGTDGRWVLGGTIGALGLPQSIREVVGRRVARLGESAAAALTLAAVIGRTFDVDLLGRIADVSEDEVLDALDEGVRSSVLVESSEVVGRFSFAHALINHALYDELGVTRKARLHRRVAEALEDLCGEEPGARVSELAFHWSQATVTVDASKAIGYALRAGNRALAELAPDEALRWFDQARQMLDQQDDEADAPLRCDLLIGLGEAQRQVGDFDFRQSLLEAAALASRLEDPERAARAALANSRGHVSTFGLVDDERIEAIERAIALDHGEKPERRARLLGLLAVERHFSGDSDGVRVLAEEALALARETGDRRTLAHVLRDYCFAVWSGDTIDARGERTAELLEVAGALGDTRLELYGSGLAFSVAIERGEMAAAAEHLARETELADRLGQPGLLWYAYYHTSLLALVEGRIEDAERWHERAAEAGSEGEPDALMLFGATVAACGLEAGREEEIVDLLEQSAEDNPGLPPFAGALSLAYTRLGREDEARAVIATWRRRGFESIPYDIAWMTTMALFARPIAELGDRESARALRPLLEPLRGLYCSNGSTGFGSVDQVLGMLAATDGDHEAADEYLASAAEFEAGAGMRSSLALTRLWQARSLLERGGPERTAQARTLLEQVVEAGREHGYARYASQADSLLAASLSA